MKRKLARVASAVGILAAVRQLQAAQTTVLTYHGVLPDAFGADDFLDHNFVSSSAFRRQLDYLCRHYEPLAVGDLLECYVTGRRPPRRAVVITFDDGFENNYSTAFPILRERRVPFAIFVTTGMIGASGAQLWTERVKRAIYLCTRARVTLRVTSVPTTLDLTSPATRAAAARQVVRSMKRLRLEERDGALRCVEETCGRPALSTADRERYAFLNWEQVRALADAGVEIGSHTVNHPILSTVDDERLDEELRLSKSTLERELGRECRAFAYPNGSHGDYGDREMRTLERLGYLGAFSLRGTLNGRDPDRFNIDRININRAQDDGLFRVTAAGLVTRTRAIRRGAESAGHSRSRSHRPAEMAP